VSDVDLLSTQDQPELDGQLPGFPGYLLRQAREEQGISQKEAARDLHLTSNVINALEEDNFESIRSFLFARGYIRSYARHLGLDGQALVAEFDAVYGVPDHSSKPMLGINHGGQQSKPGDTWVKFISIVFVIGLLVASVVWWQTQNGGSMLQRLNNVSLQSLSTETLSEDANQPSLEATQLSLSESEVLLTAPAEDVPSAVAPSVQISNPIVVAAVPEVLVVKEAVNEQVLVTATEPEVEVTVAVDNTNQQDALVTEDTLALAADQALLSMVFAKDCWVEVKDGDGKMILSDLYSAGDSIEQVVTAPIEVLLGRSSGVTLMTFNDQVIDLKPHTRKDIARLTLNK
jgi:cytoskeleton protein RodZ|tara:strand:+ start:2089 stop:3123 length:1035 start_codon:yes stop_codon:yes gene_type:complete